MKAILYVFKKAPFFTLALLLLNTDVYSAELSLRAMEGKEAVVLFEAGHAKPAEDLLQIYPKVKVDAENIFGWKFKGRPGIVIFSDKKNFQKTIKNPFVIAAAIPQKNMVAIDYSSMKTDPFAIETTLKHELCHLLIHQNIKVFMPIWLEEGICQWASDGTGELMTAQKRSSLHKAYLSNSLLTLRSIERMFPSEKEPLLLAYEQSRSMVEFIIKRFGTDGLRLILEYMKAGIGFEEAFERSLSLSIYQVENQWKESIEDRMSWFAYISYHIYEILFAFMALLTVIGFIRVMLKKRAYKDEPQM